MYTLFSVDDHIIEPPDLWLRRLPKKYEEVLPRVVSAGDEEFWTYEGHRHATLGLGATAGKPRDQWNTDPVRFDDMIPGCFDPAERAIDMLSQGVLASLSFPTLPRFGGMLFYGFADKELADLCVKAWNDYVIEEWCPGGPDGMFVPMMICQLWDPHLAAAEVRRCAARGVRALAFVEDPLPGGLPGFYSDYWDPLWDAVQETETVVCMHLGSSGSLPKFDPDAPLWTVMSAIYVPGMMTLSTLLFSPMLQKFPHLQIVLTEAGTGWIPAVLDRADRMVVRHEYVGPRPELLPSEIFRRNINACMLEESVGPQIYDLIGVDRILAETDYPHSDSTYPYTQQACQDLFGAMPDDVVEAITHGNAERLFRWKMADPALLSNADVVEWRARLEKDPSAALQRRRTPDGIRYQEPTEDDVDTCRTHVLKVSEMVKCGLPLDADGRCEAGHHNRRAAPAITSATS